MLTNCVMFDIHKESLDALKFARWLARVRCLHDALLEAGHVGLAEHFRDPEHPKGCWAMDMILGKE